MDARTGQAEPGRAVDPPQCVPDAARGAQRQLELRVTVAGAVIGLAVIGPLVVLWAFGAGPPVSILLRISALAFATSGGLSLGACLASADHRRRPVLALEAASLLVGAVAMEFASR